MANTKRREMVKAVKYQLRNQKAVAIASGTGRAILNGEEVRVLIRDSRDDRHWGPGSFDNMGGDLYVAVRGFGDKWEDGWKVVFSEEGFCVAPTKWARDAYTSYADCWLNSSEAEEFVLKNSAAIAALAACGVQIKEDRNLFLRLVEVASRCLENVDIDALERKLEKDLEGQVSYRRETWGANWGARFSLPMGEEQFLQVLYKKSAAGILMGNNSSSDLGISLEEAVSKPERLAAKVIARCFTNADLAWTASYSIDFHNCWDLR